MKWHFYWSKIAYHEKAENKPKHKENAYCNAILEYSSTHISTKIQFFQETIISSNIEVTDII